MFTVSTAGEPGSPEIPSEDLAVSRPGLWLVLDGATVRTDTGCTHGVPWYVRHLADALVAAAEDRAVPLDEALAAAIKQVADQHPECDLTHPGTPSAGVAVVRVDGDRIDWLALGDVVILFGHVTPGAVGMVLDDRIHHTAAAARAEADRHPIGSHAKQAALLVMKRGELAARNQPGGYWIAAADPDAARHALTGWMPRGRVRRVALLSDGAARALEWGLLGWEDALDVMARRGPDKLIALVRQAEDGDPLGERWPRNKTSDDATVIFCDKINQAQDMS